KHTLCVVQEQGHVALEARCAGVKQGLSGGQTENLYVTGTNMPSVKSTIAAKLQSDSSIDSVITLGAPFALTAVQSVKDASSKAKVYTFDTNAELVNAVKSGDVQWAIDQQPYLQGYLAVDSLWLYLNNGDTIGGGKTVLTGPSFITKDNIEAIAQYVFFFIVAETFRAPTSLATVLYASSTIGMMAVSVALLMIGGEFDLSAGVAVTTASLTASMFSYQLGLNLWIGVLVSLLVA